MSARVWPVWAMALALLVLAITLAEPQPEGLTIHQPKAEAR